MLRAPTARRFRFLLVVLALAPQLALAQTRRALLVGIDHYAPLAKDSRLFAGISPDSVRGPITDLDGAKNDARAVRGVLLQNRYGFDATNVRLLTDAEATRAGILAAIDRLLAASRPGDLVVFYYAGHGSEQRNSKSRESRGLDQTIVPFDANLTGQDIRDKEIARAFNRFLDKGVQLTLIFDSCHSGSIGRGPLGSLHKGRWAPYNPVDAADAETAAPPETRGAIILSAAQDYEVANEMADSTGKPHGAFTTALIQVLESQLPMAPATRSFAQTRAILQGTGLRQEPVLQGTVERTRRPLLFPEGPAGNGHISTTVVQVDADTLVEIAGGPATGVVPNAEFHALGDRDTTARLRVKSTLSATRSLAVRHGGKAKAQIGDAYELDHWPASATTGLTVWMPEEAPSDAALSEMAAMLNGLSGQQGVEWLSDPSNAAAAMSPTVVLEFDRGSWLLAGPRDTAMLGTHPTRAALLSEAQRLAQLDHSRMTGAFRDSSGVQRAAPTVRITAILPPSRALLAKLRPAARDSASVVRFTSSPAQANYLLVGQPTPGNQVQYAWVRPDASKETINSSTLPARTHWLDGPDSLRAGQLLDDALTLARVRSWLLLQSPAGGQPFPYHLAFRNSRTGEITRTGPFHGGDTLTVVLQLDTTVKTDQIKSRRVYVFAIDRDGKGAALFPAEEGNNGNRVPALTPDGSIEWKREIRYTADPILIGPPYGMDSYFLLSVPSSESVPFDVLNWNAARGEGVGVPRGSVAAFLFDAGSATRGPVPAPPTDWSIERLSIPSVAP